MSRKTFINIVIALLLALMVMFAGCAAYEYSPAGGTIVGNPDQTKSIEKPEEEKADHPKKKNKKTSLQENTSEQ